MVLKSLSQNRNLLKSCVTKWKTPYGEVSPYHERVYEKKATRYPGASQVISLQL